MKDNVKVLEQFQKLSDIVEKQKEEKARIKGSMDQIAKTLKQKGFNTLGEAKSHISKLESTIASKGEELGKKLKKMSDEYGRYLN